MKKIICFLLICININLYSQKKKINIIDNTPENIYKGVIILGSPKLQIFTWGNENNKTDDNSVSFLSINPQYRRFLKNTEKMLLFRMGVEILDVNYGLLNKGFPTTSFELAVNNEIYSYYKSKLKKLTVAQKGEWGYKYNKYTDKTERELHTFDINVNPSFKFKTSFDYRYGISARAFNYSVSNHINKLEEKSLDMRESYYLSVFAGIACKSFSYLDTKVSSYGHFIAYYFNHVYFDIIFSPVQIYYTEKYQQNNDGIYEIAESDYKTFTSDLIKSKFFGYKIGVIFEKSRRMAVNGGQIFFEYESHPFFEDNIRMFSVGYRLTFVR